MVVLQHGLDQLHVKFTLQLDETFMLTASNYEAALCRGTQDDLHSPTSGPMLRRGIYPSGFGKLTALSAPPQTSDSYV